MESLLKNLYKSIKGLYICTVGYFTGEYDPTLFSAWKKSKEDFSKELFKADELNYLLEQGVKHLKGKDVVDGKSSFSPNLLENGKFEHKSAAYYEKEALETLWNREVEKDIVEKMANIEEIYERGLEKVIPELSVRDSSELEQIFPKLLEREWLEYVDTLDGVHYTQAKCDHGDTFDYLLKKLISEEQKMKEMQDMLRTALSPEDLEKAIAIEKSTGVDKSNKVVFQNIIESLPTTSDPYLYNGERKDMFYPIDGVDHLVQDYSYYGIIEGYWLDLANPIHEIYRYASTPEPTSRLDVYTAGKISEYFEDISLSDLKIKPVFNHFEYEYINTLYGRPCNIPNMPKFAEGMANLVNNMEFLESLGSWGSLVQVPVNFIDYLLSFLF